jgi:hypothetical protein
MCTGHPSAARVCSSRLNRARAPVAVRPEHAMPHRGHELEHDIWICRSLPNHVYSPWQYTPVPPIRAHTTKYGATAPTWAWQLRVVHLPPTCG